MGIGGLRGRGECMQCTLAVGRPVRKPQLQRALACLQRSAERYMQWLEVHAVPGGACGAWRWMHCMQCMQCTLSRGPLRAAAGVRRQAAAVVPLGCLLSGADEQLMRCLNLHFLIWSQPLAEHPLRFLNTKKR